MITGSGGTGPRLGRDELVVGPAGYAGARSQLVAVGQERDAFERDRAERVPAHDPRVAGGAGDASPRLPLPYTAGSASSAG
jgi:hypothetical protein